MVETGDAATERAAGSLLGKLGHRARAAAPVLERRQQSADEMLRLALLWDLHAIEPDSKAIEPALFQLLQSQAPEIRLEAARDLGIYGSSVTSIPHLIRALDNDKDPDVRRQAASDLGAMGSAGLAAQTDLIRALNDDAMGGAAANALAAVGVHSDQIEAKIIKRFGQTQNRFEAESYLQALGRMGAIRKLSAVALAGAIRQPLGVPDDTVFPYLDQYDAARAVPALSELAMDRRDAVPIATVFESLRRLSRLGSIALPSLQHIERSTDDPAIRSRADMALADANDLQAHPAMRRYLSTDMGQLVQWAHTPEPSLRGKAVRRIAMLTGGFAHLQTMSWEEINRLAAPQKYGASDRKFDRLFYARQMYAELQRLARDDTDRSVRTAASTVAQALARAAPAVLKPALPIPPACG